MFPSLGDINKMLTGMHLHASQTFKVENGRGILSILGGLNPFGIK
jgi:hypothetical protein